MVGKNRPPKKFQFPSLIQNLALYHIGQEKKVKIHKSGFGHLGAFLVSFLEFYHQKSRNFKKILKS